VKCVVMVPCPFPTCDEQIPAEVAVTPEPANNRSIIVVLDVDVQAGMQIHFELFHGDQE
jgi:hypothetical protein